MPSLTSTVGVLLIGLIFTLCNGATLPLRNFKRTIPVDPHYSFEIFVDFDATKITVTVEAETTGYVGFGISPNGVMAGADIFVGGVAGGSSYFSDYHGNPGELIEDEFNNWELLEARGNGTHTLVQFSRLFETEDTVNDVPIRDEDTFIIWSFGTTDAIEYHGPNRGSHPINILDQSQL